TRAHRLALVAWAFMALSLGSHTAYALPKFHRVQQRAEAFIGVRVDADRNKVLLEIAPDKLNRDFLHQSVLATGLGTLGLDRGQMAGSVVVHLERHGKRVLMIRSNWNVRATGANAAEKRAADEAFPTSVIASFPIESESGGTLVVDATSFFLSDTYGVGETLRRGQQGTARIDAARSWIDAERTKAFPKNTEIQAVLTYAVDNPGQALRRVAPEAGSVTLEVHHSLVELPSPDGFRARDGDARSGVNGPSYYDFGQSYEGTYRGAIAGRWRLVPKDIAAYERGELTEPVTPIVYYLDPGIPAEYREALREGGMWWNKVFEAAGFKNAFALRDLPVGADPMDARYNILEWVHRAAPGPSVGPSFSDPRTGEHIRAVVRIDAWRSLIDYNIYAGLLPAAGPNGLSVSAESFAMARRRQHAAHEIGHTLGFPHNYIASSQGRTSVMDYPFPLISLNAKNEIELAQAYAPGAGAWDTLTVRYAYTWFPNAAAEKVGLEKIIKEGLAKNIRFIADQHSDANGSIPDATRWVEGKDAFDALDRTAKVRRVLIDKFDERAIKPGEPMYLLNMRFAHVYLHHRYALEGVVKYIGGMDFTYAMRGDGQTPTKIFPASDQRRALKMALDALEPAALAVPERVLSIIPPVPVGGDPSIAWLGYSGTALDQISLAGGLATEVLDGIFERDRAGRLVLFGARDAANLSLDEVTRIVIDRTWGASASTKPGDEALRRTVQQVVVNALLDRAGDAQALPEVRSIIELNLVALKTRAAAMQGGSAPDRALRLTTIRDINNYLAGKDDPKLRSRYAVIPLPWP
ncbi:MAG: zinc-dependent metalloprotease, partial [Gemmatimonadota bacterium]|nr:zinc-dependent metalloprotease [Gemmatimonadota bacterium]